VEQTELSKLIDSFRIKDLDWDFDDESETVEEDYKLSVPGKIVDCIYNSIEDKTAAIRSIGLLSTYAAMRSLMCWFLYCDNKTPLLTCLKLENYWLNEYPLSNGLDDSLCEEVELIDREGDRIVDCRVADTSSVARAVSSAALFALNKSLYHVAYSLSCVDNAFNQSPADCVYTFEKWFFDVAIPITMQGRALTNDELFALAENSIPEDVLNSRN
jgi:hypothetical protein